MRNEAYDLLVAVQHDDGRSDVMIHGVWLLGDSESLELRLGLHNRRVGTRVVSGRAIGRIMSGAYASSDDIAIGDRAQVVPVLRIIDHGSYRDVFDAQQRS